MKRKREKPRMTLSQAQEGRKIFSKKLKLLIHLIGWAFDVAFGNSIRFFLIRVLSMSNNLKT